MTAEYMNHFRLIDEDTFYRLAKVHDLILDYKDGKGYQIFRFNANALARLDGQELYEATLTSMCGLSKQFEDGYDETIPQQILKIFQDKKIDPEQFLREVYGFKTKIMGEHTGGFAADLYKAIKTGELRFIISTAMGSAGLSMRNRNIINYLDHVNTQENPFSLEHLVDIENPPVAITHDNEGTLYTIDTLGVLYAIRDGQIIQKWDDLDVDYHIVHELNFETNQDMFDIQPCIAILDDVLYLTTYDSIAKYDLTEEGSEQRKNVRDGRDESNADLISLKNALGAAKNIRQLFHGVHVKDNNVFVSVMALNKKEALERCRSDTHDPESAFAKHYIAQVTNEGITPVYAGGNLKTPFLRGSNDDLTLRVGVFDGHLYCPSSTGIALYNPDGLIEMTQDLNDMEEFTMGHKAMTKFGFGQDFLFGLRFFGNIERNMLCLLEPEYDNQEGLVKQGQTIAPTKFRLSHMSEIPYVTGLMNGNMSISAHDNGYAITNPTFKKVLIYQKTQDLAK
jgi:hypothetical protein